jgi:hypothetical protein
MCIHVAALVYPTFGTCLVFLYCMLIGLIKVGCVMSSAIAHLVECSPTAQVIHVQFLPLSLCVCVCVCACACT